MPHDVFEVCVLADGLATGRLGPFSPDTAPGQVVCRLAAGGGVGGRVVAGGEPVAGARVILHAVAPKDTTPYFNQFLSWVGKQNVTSGTTDQEDQCPEGPQ